MLCISHYAHLGQINCGSRHSVASEVVEGLNQALLVVHCLSLYGGHNNAKTTLKQVYH